ncbi:MAG: hypothetical protein ACHQQR_03910 [Gemmatimonadales bacterium]|jgi:hypothetical protein
MRPRFKMALARASRLRRRRREDGAARETILRFERKTIDGTAISVVAARGGIALLVAGGARIVLDAADIHELARAFSSAEAIVALNHPRLKAAGGERHRRSRASRRST